MSRFVEDAIERAGLLPVLRARRAGDLEGVRAELGALRRADILLLGAVADLVRAEEVGHEVGVHTRGDGVVWVGMPRERTAPDLDLLRAVAVARVAGALAARVGVDWSEIGLELAQVALGFGASDLRGPMTKKSGLPILDSEVRKVKGQGMVALAALKRREIESLVRHAGRVAVFADDPTTTLQEAARA